MKHRLPYILQSLISLTIGGIIYIFLRRNTYIHFIFNIPREFYCNISFPFDNFIRYHLPDFLWCYSMSMALYSILLPKKSNISICVISMLFGIGLEVLQYLSIISGTFDFIDCIIYVLAAIISNIFYKKRGIKNEKIN